jgi:tRNA(adenine34) deaminase
MLINNRVGIETDDYSSDEYWMSKALVQARLAAEADEVPVGAILINEENELVASGHNQPISTSDPTAHAEIVVLREAAKKLNNYRLPNTTLYVTLEPCTMCVGALVQARVKRIVYGAVEPKTGAIESAHRLFDEGSFNHLPEINGGVMQDECSSLLSDFFQEKRNQKREFKKSNSL